MMRSVLITFFKIFLVPHLLLFKFSNNKSDIIKDINRIAKIGENEKKNVNSLLLHHLASSPYFRNIFYHRTRSIVSHVLNLYCRKNKHFIIDVNTQIGGGLLSGHPYSTILNANKIGKNFFVNQLVTVGEVNGKKPTIGDNVSIYTGSIVIGDIIIGNNCVIGAGSVVVKSIPDNCVVVGNPAKIIKKDGVKYIDNNE